MTNFLINSKIKLLTNKLRRLELSIPTLYKKLELAEKKVKESDIKMQKAEYQFRHPTLNQEIIFPLYFAKGAYTLLKNRLFTAKLELRKRQLELRKVKIEEQKIRLALAQEKARSMHRI